MLEIVRLHTLDLRFGTDGVIDPDSCSRTERIVFMIGNV